jgi:hypothetical protein
MLGRGALEIPIGPTDVILGGTPRTCAHVDAAMQSDTVATAITWLNFNCLEYLSLEL